MPSSRTYQAGTMHILKVTSTLFFVANPHEANIKIKYFLLDFNLRRSPDNNSSLFNSFLSYTMQQLLSYFKLHSRSVLRRNNSNKSSATGNGGPKKFWARGIFTAKLYTTHSV